MSSQAGSHGRLPEFTRAQRQALQWHVSQGLLLRLGHEVLSALPTTRTVEAIDVLRLFVSLGGMGSMTSDDEMKPIPIPIAS